MSNQVLPKPIPDTVFVRLVSILEVVPVGRTTWWAGVKSGRFPTPIKIGPRTTVWKAEDIHQLLQDLENGGQC